MPKHAEIYVNLPVKDLPKSRGFFETMGYTFNAEMSNKHCACMILGDHLFAMLLTEPFFQGFTDKPISDAKKSTEVLVCLSCDNVEEMDELVRKAVAAGGTAPRAKVDHGFMVGHGFVDLDGHIWELVAMTQAA